MSLDEPPSPARTVPCRPWTAAPLAILSMVGGASFAGELAAGQWLWATAAAAGALSWGTLLVVRLAAHVRIDADSMAFRLSGQSATVGRREAERASKQSGEAQLQSDGRESHVAYADVAQILRTSVNRFGFDVRVTTRDGHTIPVATNILAGRASALVEAIESAVAGGRRKPVLGLDRRLVHTGAGSQTHVSESS